MDSNLEIFKGDFVSFEKCFQCHITCSIYSITNLAYDELIMKIVQSLFIHRFVHFTHKYHVLKTCLTYR